MWKHQPLPMHPQAMPAALAAEAAREQGKFWPMHEKLFAGQAQLSPEAFERAAQEIGLDVKRFKASMAARRGADRIAQDQQLAGGVGANGTPTMFFNCRQVVGALPVRADAPIAEEELKKADALLRGAKPGQDFAEKACQANLALAPAAPPQGAPVVPAALQAPVQGLTVRPDDPARGNAEGAGHHRPLLRLPVPVLLARRADAVQVEKAYGDKVRVVWKHQPLSFHPNALPAAEAAEAAREQGKFWQMHDRLFAGPARALATGSTTGSRGRSASTCAASRRRAAPAAAARASPRTRRSRPASARRPRPTMFVNGEKVEGAVPFEQLKAVIDRQLGAPLAGRREADVQAAWDALQRTFDRIFVVTLERATDRQARVARAAGRARASSSTSAWTSGRSTRSASAPRATTRRPRARVSRRSRAMAPGQIGCALSHRQLYRAAVEHGWERVLVFEDDVVPRAADLARAPGGAGAAPRRLGAPATSATPTSSASRSVTAPSRPPTWRSSAARLMKWTPRQVLRLHPAPLLGEPAPRRAPSLHPRLRVHAGGRAEAPRRADPARLRGRPAPRPPRAARGARGVRRRAEAVRSGGRRRRLGRVLLRPPRLASRPPTFGRGTVREAKCARPLLAGCSRPPVPAPTPESTRRAAAARRTLAAGGRLM